MEPMGEAAYWAAGVFAIIILYVLFTQIYKR